MYAIFPKDSTVDHSGEGIIMWGVFLESIDGRIDDDIEEILGYHLIHTIFRRI